MSSPAFLQPSAHTKRRRRQDRVFQFLCLFAAVAAVAILVTLITKVVADGAPRVNWHFVSEFPSRIFPKKAGILSPLAGSVAVMVLTILFVVPVGIAAAIYLQEFNYRKGPLVRFIQVNIGNLAGVPSIVFGMLGLSLFVTAMHLGKSILTGALTMGILVLPMVILVTQEALKAVPNSYREASLALGSTQWQTIQKAVLPRAMPGILTGIILAASRAIGETAPLIVVGAVGLVTFLPDSLQSRYTVLPLQILDWIGQPREDFRIAAAAAILVLMGMLIVLNSVAIFIRARYQSKV
ncbi:MAG: phosphate ABC transporter permease PstA [Armatimonadetes bacterium]|nr:phosphate ABC transporter permease PstA [Armatimonadota bacterium]MBS1710837.1 phosphate ABC transporter permease PstA [Armatimonadota bacterium]MBX3108509.1 phosphate ABC transporter permease PstA [Fimbriimonadaceae bacterium]